MQPLFRNSNVGTSYSVAVVDAQRTFVGCATQAEVQACEFVPVDGVVYKKLSNDGRCGLAHVRVKEQIPDLLKMVEWVKNDKYVDVYMVGGFAAQPGPADAIVSALSGNLFGYAWGINEIYGHIKKANPHLAGRQDDSGHVPAFLAVVGNPNPEYTVGTATLVGCVGVLVVQVGVAVTVKKIHLYDCEHTVQQGKAFAKNNLTIINAF